MKFSKEDHSDDPDEPWMILGIPGAAYLCLYEHPDMVVNENEEGLRISHFGFVLENFDEAYKFLQSSGIEHLYGGVVNWPNSRSLYLKDPSGHEIEMTDTFGGGLE